MCLHCFLKSFLFFLTIKFSPLGWHIRAFGSYPISSPLFRCGHGTNMLFFAHRIVDTTFHAQNLHDYYIIIMIEIILVISLKNNSYYVVIYIMYITFIKQSIKNANVSRNIFTLPLYI